MNDRKPAYLVSIGFIFLFGLSGRGELRADEVTKISVLGDANPIDSQLEELIKAVEKLRKGSTRRDLLVSFKTGGGLSSVSYQRYTSKISNYLQIEVSFKSVKEGVESPEDEIVSISRIFVSRPVLD